MEVVTAISLGAYSLRCIAHAFREGSGLRENGCHSKIRQKERQTYCQTLESK